MTQWSSACGAARFRCGRWDAFLGATLVVLLLASSAEAQPDLRAALRGVDLEPDQAHRVSALRLEVGGATLSLEEGWIVPTGEVAGQVRELVFLGSARFELEPPDPVEAGQLEVFTGARTLNRRVEEAVLVVGSDAAAAALLTGRREPADAATLAEARRLYSSWRESGERSTLLVDQMLWVDALGDPAGEGYFAGWLVDEDGERFLYNYDPWELEQISLGRFEPVELTEREERKAEKLIGKQQRKGRLIGLEVAALGIWDSWVSASPRDEAGRPLHGSSGFEARHYVLSVEIEEGSLEMEATSTLVLRATSGGVRVVPLSLMSDLVVESVADASGAALEFEQTAGRLLVVLPRAVAVGEEHSLRIRYRGRVFDEWDRARVLRTPTGWYPSFESNDRATFDFTIRWPRRFDIVASGSRVAAGEEGEARWERRRVDEPARSFTFELGRFDTHVVEAGDVTITVALDPDTRRGVRKQVDGILETAREALLYFEELFGDYPFDTLTIVTLPRIFSQATPGLVTLDRWSAFDAASEEGAAQRAVLAHEIAHQWWGLAVDFESYRDQWMVEGMAEYSALLYVRNRGKGERVGPTRGWKRQLQARTRDGRTVESLGPLVLGPRLSSSLSSSAHISIVYGKGAVVLDMLARSFGEETFVKVLRALLDAVRGRSISTEDFFELIERITGTDLDAFTEQFIYETGLPRVYYDYTVEKTGDGEWRVRGEAIQSSPYRLEYHLVERRDGLLDIEREQVVQMDVERSILVVPVQAVLYDPSRETEVEEPEVTGNRVMQFHALLRGRSTPFEFRAPHEPKQVWLDAREEVFGDFVSLRRSPKRVLYYQAMELATAKRWDEAEDRLGEALAAKAFEGPAWDREVSDPERDLERASIDARVHWGLLQIYLDQGRTQSAQAAFDAAEEAWEEVEKLTRSRYRRERKPLFATVLEARLDLQKGNPQRAYEVLRADEGVSREWYLSMALAARALGRVDEFEEARDEAEERGADVTLFAAARTGSR